jgi:hypothetical protein
MVNLKLSTLPLVFLLTGLLFVLSNYLDDYNLPGQNFLVPVFSLVLLTYQANNLKMTYARNILVGVIVAYILFLSSYSEPGTYDPRAMMSFVVNVLKFWAVVMLTSLLIK